MGIKRKLKKIKKSIKCLRNQWTMEDVISELRDNGAKIGENCRIYDSNLDFSYMKLIQIGNNCVISHSTILAHDESISMDLGYLKVGRVKIGDNVFVGYGSIILPNVTIGNNVIIGAGSVVRNNIPDNCVVCGNPAVVICAYSKYIKKHEVRIKKRPQCPYKCRNMTQEDCEKLLDELKDGIGYAERSNTKI